MKTKLDSYPFVKNCKHCAFQEKEPELEAYLNRAWRPTLSIIGIDGLSDCSVAPNLLRPDLTAKISIRLPPHLKADNLK